MFTGIIESVGEVAAIKKEGSNVDLLIQSPISDELRVDQSVSHNGVCLTVTKKEPGAHWVTAVDETIGKSNVGLLKKGDLVNLERSMLPSTRFDGHIVQGHVDQTAVCRKITAKDGSWLIDFELNPGSPLLVEKGSVAVNGISLTCFNVSDHGFSVEIIPFTFEHTGFKLIKIGQLLNIEFDIIGKYVQKLTAR